ncbi:MAG TPA: SDR family oxidoreductase [Polyangiaceae bacterium]|nr:SDR family oxidoreductase [Polyangiaceae bacterium]
MSDTAIVTGASAGIGAAFARALAARGKSLVLVARDGARLEGLAPELRAKGAPSVTVLPADLTAPADLVRVEQAVRSADGLSLLVNNAGFGTAGAFVKSSLDAEDREIRLNVLALVHLCHAAAPRLVARGSGGIINVSSVQGFFPSPFVATYGATKAFVTSFSEALAGELAGTGVTVQTLCPGFTRTEFQERAGMKTGDVPRSAWMTPESVVAASLEALDRGDALCVPGAQNAALVGLEKLIPRALTRKITARLNRRVV